MTQAEQEVFDAGFLLAVETRSSVAREFEARAKLAECRADRIRRSLVFTEIVILCLGVVLAWALSVVLAVRFAEFS